MESDPKGGARFLVRHSSALSSDGEGDLLTATSA